MPAPGQPPRPGTVRAAFALMVAELVEIVVNGVYALSLGWYPEHPADGNAPMDMFAGPGGHAFIRAVGLTYLAGLLAVDLVLALNIRHGRRWAWLVKLVFAVVSISATAATMSSSLHGDPFPAIGLVLSSAIVALLLLRPTRRFIWATART